MPVEFPHPLYGCFHFSDARAFQVTARSEQVWQFFAWNYSLTLNSLSVTSISINSSQKPWIDGVAGPWGFWQLFLLRGISLTYGLCSSCNKTTKWAQYFQEADGSRLTCISYNGIPVKYKASTCFFVEHNNLWVEELPSGPFLKWTTDNICDVHPKKNIYYLYSVLFQKSLRFLKPEENTRSFEIASSLVIVNHVYVWPSSSNN